MSVSRKIPVDEAFALLRRWVSELDYAPVIDLMAAGHDSPWKLLASTMLSARTKDAVTTKASKSLFSRADTPEKTAELSVEELAGLIYPVGFYRTKAENLKKLAADIVERFGGIVPETLEELTTLPGVGVKTASLVLIKAFDKYEICVDTHVHRISNMWGLVSTKTPEETREALKKSLPKEYWKEINQELVTLGQTVCRPVRHDCCGCPLKEICPKSGL
ncbi:endonuclease III [bacterium]|nr:endonuclease III [bacterium]MBR6244109.1 endonuclease III [bacterium]